MPQTRRHFTSRVQLKVTKKLFSNSTASPNSVTNLTLIKPLPGDAKKKTKSR